MEINDLGANWVDTVMARLHQTEHGICAQRDQIRKVQMDLARLKTKGFEFEAAFQTRTTPEWVMAWADCPRVFGDMLVRMEVHLEAEPWYVRMFAVVSRARFYEV